LLRYSHFQVLLSPEGAGGHGGDLQVSASSKNKYNSSPLLVILKLSSVLNAIYACVSGTSFLFLAALYYQVNYQPSNRYRKKSVFWNSTDWSAVLLLTPCLMLRLAELSAFICNDCLLLPGKH
jgi:hypothetical protein